MSTPENSIDLNAEKAVRELERLVKHLDTAGQAFYVMSNAGKTGLEELFKAVSIENKKTVTSVLSTTEAIIEASAKMLADAEVGARRRLSIVTKERADKQQAYEEGYIKLLEEGKKYNVRSLEVMRRHGVTLMAADKERLAGYRETLAERAAVTATSAAEQFKEQLAAVAMQEELDKLHYEKGVAALKEQLAFNEALYKSYYEETEAWALLHAKQMREVEDYMYKEGMAALKEQLAFNEALYKSYYEETEAWELLHAKQMREVEDYMYKEGMAALKEQLAFNEALYKSYYEEIEAWELLHAKQMREVEDYMYKEKSAWLAATTKRLEELNKQHLAKLRADQLLHARQQREVEDYMYASKVRQLEELAAAQYAADQLILKEHLAAITMQAELDAIYHNKHMAQLAQANAANASMVRTTATHTATVGGLFHKLGLEGNNLHSAVRGLASGFNGLWLTWGQTAPLLAGAAISFGFVSMAKQGAIVADTLALIQHIGGNTTAEMVRLKDALIDLGNTGPVGPVKIAEAMKVMSLAGMKAAEITGSLKTVMNFSVAGDTDLKTSADTLVSVSTAFGLGSQNFTRVADVISKAAAESKSSVESFSEAMKTASVIHKQYGVTLEDTAVQIAALSQLGIEGSAAGTALRNMYADLSGRSKQVARTLKEQGIELRESNGQFKSITEVISVMDEKLRKFSGIDQVNLIQKIFGERGAKDFIEMLDNARTKAEELHITVRQAMEGITSSVKNSEGFTAIGAAKMALTTEKQFKSTVATLQTSLVTAFEELEPHLNLIFNSLKQTFASREFIEGLKSLALGVSSLIEAVVTHIDTLVALAKAYYGVKLAAMGLIALESVGLIALEKKIAVTAASTVATTTNTAATNANAAATAGAAAAAMQTTGWGTLGRALSLTNVVIGAVTLGYIALEWWTQASSDTAAKAAKNYDDNLVKSLKDEADKLHDINELLRQGIALREAEAIVKARGAKVDRIDAIATAESKLQEAQTKLEEASLATVPATSRDKSHFPEIQAIPTGQLVTKFGIVDGTRVSAARNEVDVAAREKKRLMDNLIAHEKAVNEAAAEAARIEQEQRDRNALLAPKPKDRSGLAHLITEEEKRQGKSRLSTQVALDNEGLKFTAKTYDAQLKALEVATNNELALLESKHKNEIITEGDYQSQLYEISMAKEKGEKSIRDRKLSSMAFATEQAMKDAKANEKIAGDSVAKIQALEDNLSSLKQANDLADEKDIQDRTLRIQKIMDNQVGNVNKLSKTVDKFLREDANSLQAQAEEVGYAFDKYLAAGVAAASKEGEKYANVMDAVAKAMEDANTAAILLANNGLLTQATNMEAAANELQKLLDKLTKRKADAEAKAAKTAVDKLKDADFKAFTDKIADAIVKGGKDAGPSLRTILEEEFLNKPLKLVLSAVTQDATNAVTGKGTGFANTISAVKSLKDVYSFVTDGTATEWLTNFEGAARATVEDLGQGLLDVGDYLSKALGSEGVNWAEKLGTMFKDNAGEIASVMKIGGQVLSYISAIDLASQGKWGSAIGTAVGQYFFGPIGSAIGGAIGSWVDEAFGGGHESVVGQGITGTFAKSGFSGQNYTRYRNSGQSGFFGIGATSAREWNVNSAMSTGTQAQLSTSFFLLQMQTAAFAKTLGESTDSITNYTHSFTLALGADAAANQTAIAALFTSMANEMATAIVNPEFIRQGETAADALGRLGTNLLQVNAAFDLMGKTKIAGTQAGGNTASSLVDMFGGLDKFNTAQSAFYNTYYTDAEKKAKLTEQLTRSFKDLGQDLPTSREAYKQLVLNQEVITSSGQSTYASLLSLSDAFATLTDTANKATASLTDTNFATEVAYLRFKGRVGLGSSVADLPKIPGFATGGEHSGGWRVVGERGKELEYTGPSQIVSNSDSLFDTSELVAEIRALRAEVANLRANQAATAKSSDKMYKVLDKWDVDGQPATRV